MAPTLRPHLLRLLLVSSTSVLLLSGCEIPGVYPDPKVVQRDADAKATGSGCRHAMRSLEDCYAMNTKAPKAAVFAGWKEMDAYMRENKLEGVAPSGVKPAPTEEVEQAEAPAAPERRNNRNGRAS
ncbi:hypothetical protein [Variovorax sp. HJSM1_2]|uniref:hypothetical protein n=1 Tax=Variovorax sp. HJSM1_2 TaxID=3366263 RepID=UPI003BC5F88E